MVNQCIESGRLSGAVASKLRGTVQWTDLQMCGRPCRAALAALVDRQYHDPGDQLTPALEEAMVFLAFAIRHMPDHYIRLCTPSLPLVIVYTDASTEHGEFGLRLRTLVFSR